MSLHEFNIYWKIENYLFCDQSYKALLRSPYFSPFCIESELLRCADDFKGINRKFCFIYFYPKGLEGKRYVALQLCLPRTTLNLTGLNIMLYTRDKEILVAFDEKKGKLFENYNYLQFDEVLEYAELENKLKKSSDGCLIIQCKMFLKINLDDKLVLKKSETFKTTLEFVKHSFEEIVFFKKSPITLIREKFPDMDDSKFETIVEVLDDEVLIEIRKIDHWFSMAQRVKCCIYLLGNNGAEIVSHCDFFTFDHQILGRNVWRFPSFLKKSFLLDKIKKNSSCTMMFIFFISNGISRNTYIEEQLNHDHTYSNKTSSNPVLHSLQDDFLALLSNKKYADVKLLIGREMIFAHKNILASRSPIFKAMFDQDMIENQTGTIEISDINEDTMRLFLKFLYTGIVDEEDWETMLELLLAAEKYQVPSLKQKCSELLILFLNADNVCEVVSVADAVGHAVLKTAAISYIKEHAADILGSPKWPKWIEKNVVLGSEILCKFSNIITSASYNNL